ncbi:hypothetical protein [Sulfitobacter sp. M22]|uniref:hypothetical protein n=1 Tax=Sulfitobacter sp. M22 TaxID=2675332 RepID=UPI001F34F465|nr:hypothetical protein [Sulfitobacter sp. M22]MCF7725797.1 hypothetical protein [Sulfitobacter sp. M22]
MHDHWLVLLNALPSIPGEFLGRVFAVLIGAFAGAYAANWFAFRKARIERNTAELLAINAATSMTFGILNDACSFKDQYGRRTVENFRASKKHYLSALQNPPPGKQIDVNFEFYHLSHFKTPIEKLYDLCMSEINMTGIGLHAVSVLSQSLESFRRSLDGRNQAAERLEKTQMPPDEKAYTYFGINTGSGVHDTRFSDSIEGFEHSLDSVIYCCCFLIGQLARIGEQVEKRNGKNGPRLRRAEIKGIEADSDLFPERSGFPDFEKALENQNESEEKSRRSWFSFFGKSKGK